MGEARGRAHGAAAVEGVVTRATVERVMTLAKGEA